MKNNLKKAIINLRRGDCEKSIYCFARTYFKHYFSAIPAEFQLEMYIYLFKATIARGQRIAIAAPRSNAKSAIVSLIYVLWCICYKKEPYIVLLSDTREQAAIMLSNVKNELENNALLLEDFPDVSEGGETPKPPRWNQNEIMTRNGVMVSALGAGQKMRGRRSNENRPSLIILDDIENDQNTQSPDSRAKLLDWFTKAILKSGSDTTNIIVVGTIQHYDSLLAKLLDPEAMPGWRKYLYRSVINWSEHPELWQRWSSILCRKEQYLNSDGLEAALDFFNDNKDAMLMGAKVLWAEKEDYYSLMLMRERDGSWSFDSEKQNDPISRDKMRFNMEESSYWSDRYKIMDDLLIARINNLEIIGGCDLSLGCKDGDYSAIVILAKDKEIGALYVLVADIERREPDQIIEAILMYGRRFKNMKFVVETNQFQAVLYNQLSKRNQSEQVYINLEQTKNTKNKEDRLSSLQPLIKSGIIQFDRKFKELIEELRHFPKGRHDDGIDALEMAVNLALTGPTVMAWFGGTKGVNLFEARSADKTNPANGLLDPAMNKYPLPDGTVPYNWYKFNR